MSNAEKLDALLEEHGDKIYDEMTGSLLDVRDWKPVLLPNDPRQIYMAISKPFGGLTMVATWVRSDYLVPISHEDMRDLVIGADGRTKN